MASPGPSLQHKNPGQDRKRPGTRRFAFRNRLPWLTSHSAIRAAGTGSSAAVPVPGPGYLDPLVKSQLDGAGDLPQTPPADSCLRRWSESGGQARVVRPFREAYKTAAG